MTSARGLLRALALAWVAALLASCSTLDNVLRQRLVSEPAEVPAAIERAERELADGRSELALRRARDARDVRGTPPEQRDRLDLLIERAAAAHIEELAARPGGAGKLSELVEAGLPKQLAVSAGVRAARVYLAANKPYRAFTTLRKLEEKFPRHHGRAEAGEILADAGLRLADDPWGFLFFSARDDGVEVLEYLVLTYPGERRCADAFAKLAQIYEEDKRYALAIQRHEELLFSHGDHPLASASEARIPALRLRGHESPEYDRGELLRARGELEAWLSRRAGDPLEPSVRLDYADCLQRLVRSDLGIARFYERIERSHGARYHAERALRLALDTTNPKLIAEARSLLESLPMPKPGESTPLGDEYFSSESAALRDAVGREQAGSDTQGVEARP